MGRVGTLIRKTQTFWRKPLDLGLTLTITPRFLATGDSYESIGYAFCVTPNTISPIIPKTCRAIIAAHGDEVIQVPQTAEETKSFTIAFIFL